MLENILNSTSNSVSVKIKFDQSAANDDGQNVFTKNELKAIREIIDPLGGTSYASPVTFNGIDYYGEQLDIYMPPSGNNAGKHILSIHKAPAGIDDLSYAVSLIEKGSVLPCNRFHNVLNVISSMLQSLQAAQRPQIHP